MRCRRSLIPASVIAVATFSLLATGCGGSAGIASVASPATTASTTTQNGLVAYVRCMRSNGVPTFPDPNSSGQIPKLEVVNARSSEPSRFDSASGACRHLLPNGGLGPQETAEQKRTRLADELSFATCMRSRGVTRFPDPTAQGQLSVEMAQAQGIDVRSPAVLRVVQACLPASHGALTLAKISEALKNAGG